MQSQKKMECFFFEKLLKSIEAVTLKFFERKGEFFLNSERVFPLCIKIITISKNKACKNISLTKNNKLYILDVHLFLSAYDIFNYLLAK